jgi:hypothetical protein
MNNKVYIAGKITGDPNYREKFNKAEEELKAEGYIVMNPAILPEGFTWSDYMRITEAMLEACDIVYMLEDWKDSQGAQVEHKKAILRGNTIIYQKMP